MKNNVSSFGKRGSSTYLCVTLLVRDPQEKTCWAESLGHGLAPVPFHKSPFWGSHWVRPQGSPRKPRAHSWNTTACLARLQCGPRTRHMKGGELRRVGCSEFSWSKSSFQGQVKAERFCGWSDGLQLIQEQGLEQRARVFLAYDQDKPGVVQNPDQTLVGVLSSGELGTPQRACLCSVLGGCPSWGDTAAILGYPLAVLLGIPLHLLLFWLCYMPYPCLPRSRFILSFSEEYAPFRDLKYLKVSLFYPQL